MIPARLRKALLLTLALASATAFNAVSTIANSASAASVEATGIVDSITFGDKTSESGHDLNANNSQTIAGALGESSRKLLPFQQPGVDGGSLTFTMQIDPLRRNYVSVKLWGEDDGNIDTGRLYLYMIKDGVEYQIGYRHEGDYAPLSVAHWNKPLPGRFFYSTTLLPYSMTKGSTSVTLKIVSTGRLYPFGSGGPESTKPYQYAMNQPSRGIYRAYTHIDPFLNVAGEKQGSEPAATTRPSPGDEILGTNGRFRTAVNNRIQTLISKPSTTDALSGGDLRYLARAWSVPELVSYQNSGLVDKVVATLDAYAAQYYADTNIATKNWGGNFGSQGQAIYYLRNALTASRLDESVNYGNAGVKKRRVAWADMLFASREFGRQKNRLVLSNQSLIANTNIYFTNKGLLVLSDSRAFPETTAQRYIKEAVGLLPWTGDDRNGPGDGGWAPFGDRYYQVTDKGQTREWGYLGAGYGEVQSYLAEYYRVTGNEDFRKQMIKMAKARAPFRRPAIEISNGANYRAMEAIGLLAWRGAHESDGNFAGFLAYVDALNTNERAKGLRVAAASKDATLFGYAKQMLEDNQFFNNLNGAESAFEALDVFADYQTIKTARDSGARLPMSAGQPDFAWADEENAIVAVKKGNERLWLSTYWQAKAGTGINGLARFHFSTPSYDQYGVLETTPIFRSTTSYTRPNRIDMPEKTPYTPPNPPTNAYAGELLPLGIKPEGASNDEPFRGKADFYAARFGHYLIGINANASNRYVLKTPVGFKNAEDLVSQRTLSGNITVDPRSTVVLYLNDTRDAKAVPNAPLHLGAQNSNGVNTLFWTPSSGSERYKVMRSTSENGTYQAIATVTENSYSDRTGTASGRYYYRIVATNGNGESYPSMASQP
ncbi:fibronectin type III domain-containing protein [Pectobacterium aroidearum]|uniref:fibronectin type III domain-containing protein n=1 Tax=Pectobacterium aroidearum TaxID=1201031 RepID=UPI00211508D8|nr:fibronectin type III domain-containing protein [Pectobacterium aroidearum]UUE44622.1 fibronectin type III domain-containing protein [Pectobacterium aroidearum]UUE48841.1 fibronectin type III domain-containing protein [Pectobacterium aroidearum]UUE53045.1 fibronectin type III domain-containing protein [Pectobacterium aroidearum]UUE61456.1 fibronectin type III domain-containing protein [Pectobacterium aroidearum]UUE65682.1 fibronectin type III domain-containing protein [Pectobacterium aroidea